MQNRQQQPGQPGDLQQDPEQLQRDPLPEISSQGGRDPSADDLHQEPEPGAGDLQRPQVPELAAAGSSAGDQEQGQRDPLQKVKEGFDRLRGCIDAEHCEYMDCIYFENPEQLREVVCFLETAINRAEREQLQRVP